MTVSSNFYMFLCIDFEGVGLANLRNKEYCSISLQLLTLPTILLKFYLF